jgi:3-hydroxybutyryl-CoA dehydrogenase
MKEQKIVVIGAGTMGQGIVQVSAASLYPTLLFDLDLAKAEQAKDNIAKILSGLVSKAKLTEEQRLQTLALITVSSNIEDCIGDIIIEAIVEVMEVKQKLFSQLEHINQPTTILTSNTSSLSITGLASSLVHKRRFAGLHFFNPAPLMKLVEVVSGPETSSETTNTLSFFVRDVQKQPVACTDAPGFIVNRVARPYYTESLKLAEEGAADIETIDNLLQAAGFRLGPFRLMDLIGNDINFAVTTSLYNAFGQEPRFRPSRIQQQKVLAGHLGKKTGKGFYSYH